MKKVFLKISQYLQKNTCARVSILRTLYTSGNFIKKEALAQAFPYEFRKIFKNTVIQNTSIGCFLNIFSIGLSCFFQGFHCWLWACICLLWKVQNNHCCSWNPWNASPCKQILNFNNRIPKTKCEIWGKLTVETAFLY